MTPTTSTAPSSAPTLSGAHTPERFAFALGSIKTEDSGAGDGQFTVRGHAAVYGRQSHDLGGFRTVIAAGAFDRALADKPQVHFFWDHDSRWTLASTRNRTLRITPDEKGLAMWARVAPTSYAADLRVLLERGDIQQMSFAGFVGADEWAVDDDGTVIRTISDFNELLDVTVCAQGAFPQTAIAVAQRAAFQQAQAAGRVSGLAALAEAHGRAGSSGADGAGAVTRDNPAGGATGRPDWAVYARAAIKSARARLPKEEVS